MQDPMLARQPIFDRNQAIAGFELLFRHEPEALSARIHDGDLATSQLIAHACQIFGLDKLVGSRLAFLNLTRPFLLGEYTLPKDKRIVFEVLEDIVADTAMIDAARRLKEDGYTIALDDFTYLPHLIPLLEIAEYVKIDLQAIDREELPILIETVRPYDVSIVAEKIETEADYLTCRELGCDLFQGYHLGQPVMVSALTLDGETDAGSFQDAG